MKIATPLQLRNKLIGILLENANGGARKEEDGFNLIERGAGRCELAAVFVARIASQLVLNVNVPSAFFFLSSQANNNV